MSPRPQVLSDAELLEGAARTIGRIGIMRLTLADVATELGISPGTLVHRFGSKRRLLLSLMRRSVEGGADRLVAMRAARGSPYATLLALGDRLARYAQTPQALANNLAFLQVGLGDPEFYDLWSRQARSVRKGIRSLIRDAVAAGELEPCDADKLALAVQATMIGSQMQWAIDREGTLAARIRANLTAMLKPLERGRRRRRTR